MLYHKPCDRTSSPSAILLPSDSFIAHLILVPYVFRCAFSTPCVGTTVNLLIWKMFFVRNCLNLETIITIRGKMKNFFDIRVLSR